MKTLAMVLGLTAATLAVGTPSHALYKDPDGCGCVRPCIPY